MTTTTAWAIWYPTDAEPVAPLEGLFQQQADSVDLAMTLLQGNVSYAVVNQAARDLLYPGTPPLGSKVWRKDTLTEEIYLTSGYGGTAGWKPWNSVFRNYSPTLANFILGTGNTNTIRWGYVNGWVHVIFHCLMGTGAAWNNPTFTLPVPVATWYDDSAASSPDIGRGSFEDTEGGSAGRYQLSVIVASGLARVGAMQTVGGGTIVWSGIGPGALGIDPGDKVNIHLEYPAF